MVKRHSRRTKGRGTMNYQNITTDILDLLRRHELIGEVSPKVIQITLKAPWDVEVYVEH